ncbi:isoleucine N-monooxygenase 2-like [Lycium barbarum]|uniref:isoleucine N-monooxygenase 2-like n=1 Tax=Lycium barbarum TaxID=112863 RepID=UPI00293F20E3|nr:isoleucine N-monooxygenase 2-like [Lycium barbarum]
MPKILSLSLILYSSCNMTTSMTKSLNSFAFLILLLTFFWLFPILISKYLQNRKFNNSSSSFPQLPPGPKPWPILGCLPQMILTNMSRSRWVHKVMDDMNTDIACIRLGNNVHIIPVTSPELACEFLIKKDSIFSSRPQCMAASRLITSGYLTTILTNGDQWKKMKRVITNHILSATAHQRLHDKRMEESDYLIRHVYDQCAGQRLVNVRSVARHFCGNVMRKILFNKRFLGNGNEEEQVNACFTVLDHIFGFSVSDYLPSWISKLDLDGHEKILREALRCVKKYQDSEIDARINMWKDDIKTKEEDVLDILIQLKDGEGNPLLTVEEIKAEVIEVMLAVVDNPSNAVEWALAEMLNQPKTLEKAKQELDTIVGRDNLVQESHFPKLNYVKACLKEAFRLHPVALFNIPHVAISDTIVDNYFIPKGSHVLISRLGLGRNPRIWPEDPLMFKPERHLILKNNTYDEVIFQDPTLRMFAFSAGRRGCPGVLLGSDITIMMFARLLQGFNWSLPPNHVQRIDLIESPNNMYLAQPLMALAEPRLTENMYPLV